jgi:hypothetical protein
MIVDIDKYRVNCDWLKSFFERQKLKPTYDADKQIILVSVTSQIPIIAVTYFYGEYYGFDDFIINKIKVLTDFYGYTEILGIKKE